MENMIEAPSSLSPPDEAERIRIHEILMNCFNNGILPSKLAPSTVTEGEDCVKVVVNHDIARFQADWLKEHAVSVFFYHETSSLPPGVKSRLITYVASAKQIASWMLMKKESKVTLDNETHTVYFRPWMSEHQLLIWRDLINRDFFWIRCLDVPVSAMGLLKGAVEDAFGSIIRDYAPFKFPVTPDLRDLRFDLALPAKARYKQRLIVDLWEFGSMDIQVACSDTPWCAACRRYFHKSDDNCPKKKKEPRKDQKADEEKSDKGKEDGGGDGEKGLEKEKGKEGEDKGREKEKDDGGKGQKGDGKEEKEQEKAAAEKTDEKTPGPGAENGQGENGGGREKGKERAIKERGKADQKWERVNEKSKAKGTRGKKGRQSPDSTHMLQGEDGLRADQDCSSPRGIENFDYEGKTVWKDLPEPLPQSPRHSKGWDEALSADVGTVFAGNQSTDGILKGLQGGDKSEPSVDPKQTVFTKLSGRKEGFAKPPLKPLIFSGKQCIPKMGTEGTKGNSSGTALQPEGAVGLQSPDSSYELQREDGLRADQDCSSPRGLENSDYEEKIPEEILDFAVAGLFAEGDIQFDPHKDQENVVMCTPSKKAKLDKDSTWPTLQEQYLGEPAGEVALTSLDSLQSVERRIVRTVELAGMVAEELGNPNGPSGPNGPRPDAVTALCKEFMTEIKETQKILREQIKGMCEYRPFENCDYQSRMAAEISLEKLKLVAENLEGMNETAGQYHSLNRDDLIGSAAS
ncbi:hypothetical protein CBR_g27782 [Chara braunii]|uniref:Mediator of RNA polymerase II transcription subunit 11 n=1 Tax=Chara braunii TaxID=69332 RepID=A0A388L8G3_CHABU|nr:hypothetical protein CBR_g27782 [Chara braunii]|eukprot:GBG78558.1 hypothetical protein CBR_g27782 [Chara braunii]